MDLTRKQCGTILTRSSLPSAARRGNSVCHPVADAQVKAKPHREYTRKQTNDGSGHQLVLGPKALDFLRREVCICGYSVFGMRFVCHRLDSPASQLLLLHRYRNYPTPQARIVCNIPSCMASP